MCCNIDGIGLKLLSLLGVDTEAAASGETMTRPLSVGVRICFRRLAEPTVVTRTLDRCLKTEIVAVCTQVTPRAVRCFPPFRQPDLGAFLSSCFVAGGARGIPGPVRSDPSDRDVLELYKEKNTKLQVRFEARGMKLSMLRVCPVLNSPPGRGRHAGKQVSEGFGNFGPLF